MRLVIKFSREFQAARRSVFRAVTNFDNLQERFPNIFSSIRVLDRSGNHVTTEEGFFLMGVVVTQRSRHELKASTAHRIQILTGDLAGSTIVEDYSDGPEGTTVVRVEAEFTLGGLMSLLPRGIAGPLVESAVVRIFDELERSLASGSKAGSSGRARARSG